MAPSPGWVLGLRRATVCAVLCALGALGALGAVGLQLRPAMATTVEPDGTSISAADIIVRGALWVDEKVPYSQHAYFPDLQGHAYRTDCSGFISMAWHLRKSLTTLTLPEVAVALGAVGDYSKLQPGDMLDSTAARHAVLFVRWADPRRSTAVVMEEAHPGTAARVQSSYYTTSLLAAQFFVAYRYDRLQPANQAMDWNQDGYSDVIARRAGDGTLWLFPGTAAGGLGHPRLIGTGWARMTAVVEVSDFDGDGQPDLLARKQDGSLWLYPGNGHGGLRSPRRLALHWNVFDTIVSAGDFDGDGNSDLVTHKADGTVWLYPGDGHGGFERPRLIASHWSHLETIVSAGDFDGDGYPDLVGRLGVGTLRLHAGNAKGGWATPKTVLGWMAPTRVPAAIGGPAAGQNDARIMSLTRRADGGTDVGVPLRAAKPVAAPSVELVSPAGEDGDVLTRRADGTLWLSKADGVGHLLRPARIAGSWTPFNLVL
jgi:FG-GAP-like repeat